MPCGAGAALVAGAGGAPTLIGDAGCAIGAAAGGLARGEGAATTLLVTTSRDALRSLRDGAGVAGAIAARGAAVAATGALGAAVRMGAAELGAASPMREDAVLSGEAPARTGMGAEDDADIAPAPNEEVARPFGVAVALAGAPPSAKSSAIVEPPPTGITPPQTEQRARTDAAIFAGSTRNTDRHSGQLTFTSPPSR